MSRERWMALCFALGSTCFLVGPFPGYAQLVGATADAVTFFVGSILFTAGGALQTLRRVPRAPLGHRRAGRVSGPPRSSPRARCSSTSPRIRRCTRRSRTPATTGSCGGRTRSARSAFSSRARSPTAPRAARLAAGARRPGMVGTGDQPARLHLLRDRGRRRLPRPSTGSVLDLACGELEHRAGRRLLPDVRAGHAADRPHPQVTTAAAPARARA